MSSLQPWPDDRPLRLIDFLLGRAIFADIMKHRKTARYFAFDLLFLNGEDLRSAPLAARKKKLLATLPSHSTHVLYVDHTIGAGRRLFEFPSELDLEGIVAKRSLSPYEDHSINRNWIKIKNPRYSQKKGWLDLFKKAG